MPTTPHIGFVSSTYYPIIGGMTIYLRQLARALSNKGHKVSIVTRFRKHQPPSMRALHTQQEPRVSSHEDHLAIHVISTSPSWQALLPLAHRFHYYPSTENFAVQIFSHAFKDALLKHLKKVDVIHYSGTGRELLGFAAAQVAQTYHLPFIITPHIHINAWGDSLLDLKLYQQANAIIALTNTEKAHLTSLGIPENKVFVIGNGTNVTGNAQGERFRKEHNISGPMILFMGRKMAYKGFHRLLRAMPLVWHYHPEAHFVFAGPEGSDPIPEELENLLKKDRRVLNLPAVSDTIREELYAACDILCVPSQAEAFGMVYLEAWRYKKPVVGLDIPTLRELIEHNQAGILCTPHASAIAEALIRLLEKPDLRSKLGENGYRTSLRYQWPTIAQKISNVYSHALQQIIPSNV